MIAGVHGDEIEGVAVGRALMAEFQKSFPFQLRVTLIPEFNPDGVLLKQRTNSAGIDLNRNLPTSDWSPVVKNPRYPPGPHANSEPENQALVEYLKTHHPALILSLHSYQPCINVNGDCRAQAEILARWTGSPIVDSIGYPTPGCLGTYTGIERGMPTITYEIERGLSLDRCIEVHVPAILEVLKYQETLARSPS